MVNIIQWNCQGIRNKKEQLQNLLATESIHICILSETFLTEKYDFHLRGYFIERDDRLQLERHNPYGGAAIVIHKSIKYKKISIAKPVNNMELVAISTSINNMEICIISIYVPPLHKIQKIHWKHILNQVNNPVIFAGDFNAHNPTWSLDQVQNYEGKELSDFIDEEYLFIANNESPTRVSHPFKRDTILDLTITSSAVSSLMNSWEVLKDNIGSDHFPILFKIGNGLCHNNYNLHRRSIRNYKGADWQQYKNSVAIKISDITPHYEEFVQIINEAAEECIPNITINGNSLKIKPLWWDSICNQMVARRRLTLTNFNRNSTIENYLIFKKQQAITQRYFKKRRRQEYRNYCEKIHPKTTAREVWDIIRKLRGTPISQPVQSTNTNWISEFANNYCGNCNDLYIYPMLNFKQVQFLDDPMEINELIYSLNHTKKTSTGIDNINYEMIQEIPTYAKQKLVHILNQIFDSRNIPVNWKEHIIVPILKPSKDPDIATSYRPITLLSCLGKTMETIIKNRLEWFLEHYRKLSPSQYGFRKNRSTLDNLNIFNMDIQKTYTKNNYMIAVFLDIKGAYDSVLYPILIQKLQEIGITEKVTKWIISYFERRSIYVRYKNELIGPYVCNKGLPQGAILSPLLYTIYTKELNDLIDHNTFLLQYADDIVLYTSGSSLSIIRNRINSKLKKLEKVLDRLKLEISIEKSQAVIFSRHKITESPLITFKHKTIKIGSKVKFLGVYFDTKSTWSPQIDQIIMKCNKGINVLRSLTGCKWGASPRCLIMLYHAIIGAHLDYSSCLISTASNSKLQKLDRIQFRAIRIALGLMISTPTQILQSEANIPPLQFRRQFLADKYYLKCKSIIEHPTSIKIKALDSLINNCSYWDRRNRPNILNSHFRLQNINTEENNNIPVFKTKFKEIMGNMDININNRLFSKQFNNDIIQKNFMDILNGFDINFHKIIYTDGSVNIEDNKAGFAIYESVQNKRLKYRLNCTVSSFLTEKLAICKALQINRRITNSNIIIISDALSVLQNLKTNNYKSNNDYLICEIKKLYYDLTTKRQNTIKLLWIPAHKGITGNEVVDSLAKEATRTGILVPLQIPIVEIFRHSKKFMYTKWEEYYNRKCQHTGKLYFKLNPKLTYRTWFSNESRSFISTVLRLRSGHCQIPVHLHKINILPSPNCLCGEEGNMDHVLLGCINRKNEIDNLLTDLVPYFNTFPVNISEIILEPIRPAVQILVKYILSNNIML